jgi:hypothetical protein
MLDGQAIENRMLAERLRTVIRQLDQERESLTGQFRDWGRKSIEEQLALDLALAENRKRTGALSRELLRLVCV